MSVLNPLSIATDGYVCRSAIGGGSRCPEPIAIATLGYICADRVARVNILAGDGGTGIQRKEAELIVTLAPALVTAIEELEGE